MGRNVSDIILPNDKYIIENYYFEGKGDRGKKMQDYGYKLYKFVKKVVIRSTLSS